MSREDYQKEYKQKYNGKNKIVTLPLSNAFYEELNRRAVISDIKVNSFAKNIIVEYLNLNNYRPLSKEKIDLISDYIRVNRGIATNINQLAYNSNIGKQIDTSILISSLKKYEDEFKNFMSKV